MCALIHCLCSFIRWTIPWDKQALFNWSKGSLSMANSLIFGQCWHLTAISLLKSFIRFWCVQEFMAWCDDLSLVICKCHKFSTRIIRFQPPKMSQKTFWKFMSDIVQFVFSFLVPSLHYLLPVFVLCYLLKNRRKNWLMYSCFMHVLFIGTIHLIFM